MSQIHQKRRTGANFNTETLRIHSRRLKPWTTMEVAYRSAVQLWSEGLAASKLQGHHAVAGQEVEAAMLVLKRLDRSSLHGLVPQIVARCVLGAWHETCQGLENVFRPQMPWWELWSLKEFNPPQTPSQPLCSHQRLCALPVPRLNLR